MIADIVNELSYQAKCRQIGSNTALGYLATLLLVSETS